MIHPTAIIDPAAEIGAGCEIGPYCIIGPGVVLGEGCWLQHHVTLCGPSRIGRNNRFFAYASIGQQTQDLKYKTEPTYLEIGDDNTFREFVTVHRATSPGDATQIGHRGNFLAYAHIAHDCIVGNDVIFSNNGTLAGHVVVEDHVIVGGLTAVHQFCRLGRFAMLGGCTKVIQDVPPFTIADGNPAEIRGINKVGLERNGFAAANVRNLRDAYKILFRRSLPLKDALAEIRATLEPSPELDHLTAFCEASQRGITR